VRGFVLCITGPSFQPYPSQNLHVAFIPLEETHGLTHGRFEVKGLDVLPVLLQEGDKEVDTQHDIGEDLVVVHLDVANGDTETQDLLELEFDGGADFGDFVGQILSGGDGGGEFAGFGETRSEKTRNLLDQGFRREESIVFLGELFDKLLVLVQLLQVISGHVLLVNLLSAINIGGIGKDTDGHAWTGDIREFDSSRETLISLGIVVLETNLKLDGFHKVSLFLAICFCEELFDGAPHA